MTDDTYDPFDGEADFVRTRKRNFLVGLAVAFIMGTALVVFVVLPAEFGIDPTGFGKATRLSEIAVPVDKYLQRGLQREGVLVRSDTLPLPEPGARDHWEFELGPFEGIELKYIIPQGKPINFYWSATGPLDFDMHAHPFDGGTELTESYAIERADHFGGRYIAPFMGMHGWYWQNRSMNRVMLTVDASGYMIGSKIFDRSGEHDRALSEAMRPNEE